MDNKSDISVLKKINIELKKPSSVYWIVNKELRSWKRSKRDFALSALRISTAVWMSIPALVLLSSLMQWFDGILPRQLVNLSQASVDKNAAENFLNLAIGSQATIVGLVIPVIFALVEQFFRSQHIFFRAFLYFSKVIWLSLSSLALISFLIWPVAINETPDHLTYFLGVIWFVANMAGTAYLLGISLAFFSSQTRLRLIQKYTRSVLLPQEFEDSFVSLLRERFENEKLLFGGWVQKIHRLFAFRIISYPKTNQVLLSLRGLALEDLRNGNIDEFRSHFRNMLDTHVYLISQSAIPGKNDNLSLWPVRNAWADDFNLQKWTESYRLILAESVQSLEKNPSFFHTCCHFLVWHLYARLAPNASSKLTAHFIKWATVVFFELSREMQKTAIRHLNRNFSRGEEVALPFYLHNLYAPELKRFIGSWEDLRTSIIRFIPDERKGGVDENRLLDLRGHLFNTNYLIRRSVMEGDRVSAEWMADVLLRWNDGLMHLREDRSRTLLDGTFSYTVNQPIVSQLDPLLDGKTEDDVYKGKLKFVTNVHMNLWFDSCVYLFGSLYEISVFNGYALGMDIAVRIFHQKLFDTGSNRLVFVTDKMSNAASVFASYVRVTCDYKYGGLVNEGLGRDFEDSFSEGMVPGRVYTGAGDDFKTVSYALALIALSLSGQLHKRKMKSLTINNIVEYLMKDAARLDSIEAANNSLFSELERISPEFAHTFFSRLLEKAISAQQIRRHIRRIRRSLPLFWSKLKADYHLNVAMTAHSEMRRKDRQALFNREIFKDVETTYPLTLFRSVEITSEQLPNRGLRRYNDCPREMFLAPSHAVSERYFPNEEAYIDHVRDVVLMWPLDIALQRCYTTRHSTNDPHQFWSWLTEAVDNIRREGGTPIVLADRSVWPDFFVDWDFSVNSGASAPPSNYFREDNNDFLKKYPSGYREHLYGVPVFNNSMEDSGIVILAQEVLQIVKYQRSSAGDLLSVDFEMNINRMHTGIISFEWHYQVEISVGAVAVRIDWQESA